MGDGLALGLGQGAEIVDGDEQRDVGEDAGEDLSDPLELGLRALLMLGLQVRACDRVDEPSLGVLEIGGVREQQRSGVGSWGPSRGGCGYPPAGAVTVGDGSPPGFACIGVAISNPELAADGAQVLMRARGQTLREEAKA